MRVTQGMLTNNMLQNLASSNQRMNQYMEQLSTGKKITRPSDDPVIAMKGMDYRTEVKQVEQYMRNTSELHNWMDNSDAALDKTTQGLQRLRELAVQASNDTYDAEERLNIQEEAMELKEHLVEIANTQVNDKYIFNGTDTNSRPVADDGTILRDGETQPVEIAVAQGTTLQASVNPDDVFSQEFFTRIDQFITGLGENDRNAIEGSLEAIDENINATINTRAELGARMNRLELVENRLSEQEIIATRTMSENEDVDYSKAIMELMTQESLHRAALSAGSRIIQPSLMDFLR
ncbi:flagellar hook-associated protein FlgL [Lentibacillus sediminis]|uniref:flagellar hook-associated protein FlgL n=1 Tax=Lentibacillus sediminis TaxID=1940529 RepID=UPI000C1C0B95|nr:flagellar hook-associated protein FlgL [Lentibacillus sediminis]